MAVTDTQLDKMLSFDPLASAETMTGNSYKEDKSTLDLGFGLAILHNERKNAELIARDDTHYGISFADTVRIYESLGFVQISERKFVGNDTHDETLTHLWRAGILAQVESYGESLNTTKIWYNWQPNPGVELWSFISSGHIVGDPAVLVGDHDARVGLRRILARMEANGTFLETWVDRSWLWLLAYSDTDGDYDYTAINEAAIQQFPPAVIDAITPTEEVGTT